MSNGNSFYACCLLWIGAVVPGFAAATEEFTREVQFEIPAQQLSAALIAFSDQSGIQIVTAGEDVSKLATPGVRGRLSISAALSKLLDGTALSYTAVGDSTVALVTPAPQASQPGLNAGGDLRLAQSEPDKASSAAPAKSEGSTTVDEVIVTGGRFSGRTVLNSPVPVDVLSSEALRGGGHTELAEALAAVVPAMNFAPVGSASSVSATRLFTYRGLPSNEVLVLINGKRWHSTPNFGLGYITFDFNSIPPTSVSSVEVLRDGAAAQYGSDAIAGVMNIRLRNDTDTELVATTGQFYAGDGLTVETGLDTGMSLRGDGFIHLSAYYRDSDATNRQGRDVRQQYFAFNASGAPVLLGTVSPSDSTPVLPSGFSFDPREFTGVDRLNNHGIGNAARREAGLSFNAELPLSDSILLYGFGGYTDRNAETPFLWRRPLDPTNNVRAIFPNGYLPVYEAKVTDTQLATGAKGVLGTWDWDLSGSWGFSKLANYGRNTINPSLGTASPTNFFAGTQRIDQAAVNLDLKREFAVGLRAPLRVAIGSEYRREGIEVKAGDPASYINGGIPVLDGPSTGAATFIGSSGILGITPLDAVDTTRNSIAGYVDIENQLTDSLLLTLAGRYEHYSDFGSTLNGKFSFHQQFNPFIALRGSASTGFRAPTLYESFYSNTGSVSTAGQIFINRTFPVLDPVAQALGAQPLEPEESTSYSVGVVFTPYDRLNITADVYRLDVDEVIIQSGQLTGTALVNFLAARGYTGINSARFFTNAVDKRVEGLDLSLDYTAEFSGASTLTFSAGVNFNRPEVLAVDATPAQLAAVTTTPLFSPRDVVSVERGSPRSRINASAIFHHRDLQVLLRETRYGSTEFDVSTALTNQVYDAKWITDLEVGYDINAMVKLTAGAQNLFDVYPDEASAINNPSGMLKYPTSGGSTPFGYSGGLYYLRAMVRF